MTLTLRAYSPSQAVQSIGSTAILRVLRQIEIAYDLMQFSVEDCHYDPLLKLI